MARRANGEGSIYQRGDGRWAASISIGRLKRKHFLGKTRSEVAAKMTEALADRQKGIPIVSNNMTVAEYLQSWLKSVKSSVRPRTYESYDLNVRRLTPLLGKRRLNQLTPAIVESAYADLAASGLSNRSIVQAHTVLHNAMKKALQWGLIGRNPTEAANVPRPLRNEMKTLSEEEARQLFTATADDELHALWVVLTTTGLRLGEALGLKWSDVDFENQRLVVRRALQRQHENGLVFVDRRRQEPAHGLLPRWDWRSMQAAPCRATGGEAKGRSGLAGPRPYLLQRRWSAARARKRDAQVPDHSQAGGTKEGAHPRPPAHGCQPPPRAGREPEGGPGDAGAQHDCRDDGHLLARDACASRRGSEQNAGVV